MISYPLVMFKKISYNYQVKTLTNIILESKIIMLLKQRCTKRRQFMDNQQIIFDKDVIHFRTGLSKM